MTNTNFSRIAFAVLIMVALSPIRSWAQDDVSSYKVGERVEYRDRLDKTVWFEGTIVRLSPSSEQVVIRLDPRAGYEGFTHNGVNSFEQGYNMDCVRHIKARTADEPEDKNDGANAPVNPANNARKDKTDGAKTADTQGGTGLMTKQEILGYMKTNGYVNGQPKYDQQVCRDLIEQMKRRGVKESFTPGIEGDDTSPIYKNGCVGVSDDVVRAAAYNLGTPTTLDWLSGTWVMNVIGGVVYTAPGDGYIYRKNESFAHLGFVTINGNGTYSWKVGPSDPPAKYVKGTWRNATKKEMGLQGGAGIVLLKAAEGYDWIAFKNQAMSAEFKADRIEVEELQYRGSYRRTGGRK